MEAGKIRLLELVGSSKRTFNIPVYQRNYDWKAEQCKKLFLDIENIARTNYEIEHFLGTIVYVVDKPLPNFTEYILIDGQQRITSITLLIKALYDEIEDTNQKEDILEEYLINKRAKENFRLKLKSIDSDMEAYRTIMQDEEVLSDSNITKNYYLFKEMISKSEFSPTELFLALNYIDIVYISLEKGKKSENPQMIFESLNSTGLSLTQADLIRNYLLMNHSYEKQISLYNGYWLKIEESLSNSKISEFVRDYLTMKTGKIPKKGNVYETFKEYVGINKDMNEEDALNDLLIFSKYYAWFLFCKSPYSSLNNLLLQFQQLKSTVIYPTLLYIFHDCFANELFDIKELEDISKILISYLYRRIVCEYPANALNKIFATFPNDLGEIQNRSYKDKVLEILSKRSGNAKFPRNEEFRKSFINKNLYSSKIHKYTLYQLEKYGNKEVIELNDEITIEHIMPQTLTPIWRKDLGSKYDEIHSELLHTIGNLTLTAYNGNLSNKSFTDKKEILNDSNISISRDIKKYEIWNETSIKDRADNLFNIAKEVWNLPEEYNKFYSESKAISYETEYNLTDEINVTGETPRKVIIMDMEYNVTSWRDVVREICDQLYYLDSELFKTLTNHKDFEGKTKRRIAVNSENMKRPYKLANDLYVELHGSAVELINYSILIAEKFEMENEISFLLKPKHA